MFGEQELDLGLAKEVPQGPKDDMDKATGDPNKKPDGTGGNDRPKPVGTPQPRPPVGSNG